MLQKLILSKSNLYKIRIFTLITVWINFECLSMIRHLFTATGKVTRASFSLHPKGTLKSYALEVLIKRGNGNHGLQGGEDGEGVIKN